MAHGKRCFETTEQKNVKRPSEGFESVSSKRGGGGAAIRHGFFGLAGR